MSLTDKSALAATEELSIKIKADKENNILHVTDTGIGMTKDDLVKNLGTIAKSGTSEFFQKMTVRTLYSFYSHTCTCTTGRKIYCVNLKLAWKFQPNYKATINNLVEQQWNSDFSKGNENWFE